MKARETEYKGHLFRSGLEARWAAFFDLLGWPWVYEPFELAGYIPDFVLQFKQPLLVEVKPELALDALREHAGKIERSGWTGEALIVGADWTVFSTDGLCDPESMPALGLLCDRAYQREGDFGWWAAAPLITCADCGQISLVHCVGLYGCRRCNPGGTGDHHLRGVSVEYLRQLWGEAHRLTRWTPARRRLPHPSPTP